MTLLRSTLLLLELLAGSSALRLATSARTSRISCSAETSNLKVLVPIGEGSEEIETACIQDVLVSVHWGKRKACNSQPETCVLKYQPICTGACRRFSHSG